MAITKVTSLADIVYEQVERDILSGIYQRGDILTELKLSERLKVSRTPVREALRRLEQDDLVESRGKSIVVVGITPDDLMDILDIRERLEGLATARCCAHVTRQQLQELDEIVTLQEFYVDRQMPDKILESPWRRETPGRRRSWRCAMSVWPGRIFSTPWPAAGRDRDGGTDVQL